MTKKPIGIDRGTIGIISIIPIQTPVNAMPRIADPDKRCQHVSDKAQCINEQVEGSLYCKGHDFRAEGRVEASRLRHYLLTDARYSGRLATLSDHEDIKSLREEIAFARMLIETRFNMIANEGELLAACGTLNSLLLTVERLVKACNQVERNLGTLLAKPTIVALGREIIEIIIDELEDIDDSDVIIDKISDRIIPAILDAGKNQDDD